MYDELVMQAAKSRFTAHNFAAESNSILRLLAIEKAIANIDNLIEVDESEINRYGELLVEAVDKLDASIQAAQNHFNLLDFAREPDLSRRLQTINSIITGVDGLGIADLNEKAHYKQLLENARGILVTSIGTAKIHFDAHNFAGIVGEADRHQAIINEIAEVDADRVAGFKAAQPLEQAAYKNLLEAERLRLDGLLAPARREAAARAEAEELKNKLTSLQPLTPQDVVEFRNMEPAAKAEVRRIQARNLGWW